MGNREGNGCDMTIDLRIAFMVIRSAEEASSLTSSASQTNYILGLSAELKLWNSYMNIGVFRNMSYDSPLPCLKPLLGVNMSRLPDIEVTFSAERNITSSEKHNPSK